MRLVPGGWRGARRGGGAAGWRVASGGHVHQVKGCRMSELVSPGPERLLPGHLHRPRARRRQRDRDRPGGIGAAAGAAQPGDPRRHRRGDGAADLLRGITTWLLAIVGLFVAGGILLLWVCWKMWRELRTTASEAHAAREALADEDLDRSGGIAEGARARPSPRRRGRSSSRMSRCRSTTCSRSRARRASIRWSWCSASRCRSR